MRASTTTVITSSSGTKTTTFKCTDPTGHKLLCVLVITTVKPPVHTLTCKDIDNHKFKCTYIVINREDTNTKVFHKIVFLYSYVNPQEKKLLLSEKKVVVIFVTKTVVKVIHEHESSGSVRIVVIREEDDNDRPTVNIINCFSPCIQQEISRATVQNTIINAPVFITNINQVTNIVNNVNSINSINTINNNAINNAYVTNVNANVI